MRYDYENSHVHTYKYNMCEIGDHGENRDSINDEFGDALDQAKKAMDLLQGHPDYDKGFYRVGTDLNVGTNGFNILVYICIIINVNDDSDEDIFVTDQINTYSDDYVDMCSTYGRQMELWLHSQMIDD